MANALCLAPWVLLCALRSGKNRRIAPLAALVALQWLAGHPGTVLHTGMLAVLWVVVAAGGADNGGGPARMKALA